MVVPTIIPHNFEMASSHSPTDSPAKYVNSLSEMQVRESAWPRKYPLGVAVYGMNNSGQVENLARRKRAFYFSSTIFCV
jgi:hypothetical protein